MADRVRETGPVRLEALRPRRFYEDVVTQLVDLIASGRLPLGSKLPPEREMATQLGVSRNVLREACRVLEERGMVQSRQGGGRYVRALDPVLSETADRVRVLETATILDVLEVRASIEAQAAALAATRRTAAEGKQLLRAARAGSGWEHNLEFHAALAACSHNFLFERLTRQHLELLAAVRQRDHYPSPELSAPLLGEHVQIAEAVIARDAEQASRLVLDHIGHTEAAVGGRKPGLRRLTSRMSSAKNEILEQ